MGKSGSGKGGGKGGGGGGGGGVKPGKKNDGDDGTPVFNKSSSSGGVGLAVTKIVATIGTVIGSIFLVLKLFPQAVSEAYFGWLPEEYRQPACSSCCCSSSALVVLATVGIAFSYAK